MLKYWKVSLVFLIIAAFVVPVFTSANVVHADGYEGYSNVGGSVKTKDGEKKESKVKEAKDDKKEKEKEEASSDPKVKEQGGVELLRERWPDARYFPIITDDSSWWPFSSEEISKALNAGSTALFAINKQISTVVDASLQKFMGLDVINKVQDTITDASDQLWTSLKDHFMPILIVIAAVQIMFYYVAQRNGMKAGQAALKLALVIGISIVWLGNSGYYLNVLNHVSSQAEGYVMEAGSVLTEDVGEIEDGEEVEGSTALLRNSYFKMTVERPYLIMNYGITDKEKIREDDEEGEDRIEDMLAYKTNEDGSKMRSELAEEEVDKKDNHYMDQSSVWSNIGIAFLSVSFTLTLGVPLFILAFFKVLVQFAVLMIAFILPITFVISLLPMFADSAWKSLGRLLGVFMMKMFISLLIVFTFLIFNVVDTLLPPTSVATYYLNMSLSSILMIFMLMKRNKIIEFITAGRVVSATNVGGSVRKGVRNTSNAARRTSGMARKTASHAATKGLALSTAGFAATSAIRSGVSKGGKMLKNRRNNRGNGKANTSKGAGNSESKDAQTQGQKSAKIVDLNTRRNQRKQQEGNQGQSKDSPQNNGTPNQETKADNSHETESDVEDNTTAAVVPPPRTQNFSHRRQNRTPQSTNPQTSGEHTPPKRVTNWESDKQIERQRKGEVAKPDTRKTTKTLGEQGGDLQTERSKKRAERQKKKQENIENKNTFADKMKRKTNESRKYMVERRKRRR